MKALTCVTAVATSLVMLFSGSAFSTVVVDQQYLPGASSNSYSGIGAADFSQTFTAQINGTIDSISLLIERSTADMPSDLVFDIRRTVNSVPLEDDSASLFTKVIPRDQVPTSAGLFSIDVSAANIPIAPGEIFAIVLRSELLSPENPISYWWLGRSWQQSSEDPYLSGKAYQRSPWRTDLLIHYPSYNIETWNPNTNVYTDDTSSEGSDFGFQVLVNTSPVPGPASALLLLTGLLGLVCTKARSTF